MLAAMYIWRRAAAVSREWSFAMRFLKLLDPWETEGQGSAAVGRQQTRSRERFPTLVRATRLHLWSPHDGVSDANCRLLLGVTPGFDLVNLRLLDLICDRLEQGVPPGLEVDVLDLETLGSPAALAECFPGYRGFPQAPVVGVWRHERHERTLDGFAGIAFLIHFFGLPTSPEALAASLRPPARELVEG